MLEEAGCRKGMALCERNDKHATETTVTRVRGMQR